MNLVIDLCVAIIGAYLLSLTIWQIAKQAVAQGLAIMTPSLRQSLGLLQWTIYVPLTAASIVLFISSPLAGELAAIAAWFALGLVAIAYADRLPLVGAAYAPAVSLQRAWMRRRVSVGFQGF